MFAVVGSLVRVGKRVVKKGYSSITSCTIEECQNCGQKTKRDFRVGDSVMGEAGICEVPGEEENCIDLW